MPAKDTGYPAGLLFHWLHVKCAREAKWGLQESELLPLSLKINNKPQMNYYNFGKQAKNSIYSWSSEEKKIVMVKKGQCCLVLETEVQHVGSYWIWGNHHVEAQPASAGHNVRARRNNVDCHTDGRPPSCLSQLSVPLFVQKVRSALGYKL